MSPSGADRIMVCTASVPLIRRLIAAGELSEKDLEGAEQISEEEIIDGEGLDAYADVVLDSKRESTKFSAEGTVYHTIRADCLTYGLDPAHYVGLEMSADGFSFTITEDMADKLTHGIDWIRQMTDDPTVEQRFSLNSWWPGKHGFCDTTWLTPVPRKRDVFDLYVSDLKMGAGEPVSAEKNRQLMLYALSAWDYYGRPQVRNVILNIDQPRAGGMKFYEMPFSELLEFGEEARRVYDRIERGEVEFAPTKKGCRWCPVRKTERGCAAYNQWILWMLGASILDVSRDPVFQDPQQMARAQRFYIVNNAPAIRQWLAKLHEESLNAALMGDPDPGSKAIAPGKGTRYLKDEETAKSILVDALGEAAFKPRELIGITKIDELMKPGRKKQGHPEEYEQLQECLGSRPAKAKLVPADHPAPAYVKVDDDDFDDLGTESIKVEDDDFDELS